MTDPLDLDTLEERAFRRRFDDGLLDLAVGVFVLAFGLCMDTEYSGLSGIWGPVCFSLWFALRKTVTEPRLGYVEFRRARRDRVRLRTLLMAGVLTLSVIAGLAFWFGSASEDGGVRDLAQDLAPLGFLLSLGGLVAIGGGLLGLARGFVYAGLIVGLGFIGHLVLDELRPGLSLAGAVITVCGAVLLARFLRTHPRLRTDEGHGEA